MPRLVTLTPPFLRRARALGVVRGSALSREVGAVVSDLASAARLPEAADVHALIPPTREAWVRRVPGRNLWLWWRADETALVMLLVTALPPTPIA